MSKLYAQFDAEGVCTCVGTPNITGVEATYDLLGKKYENGVWLDPVAEPVRPEEAPVENIQILDGGGVFLTYKGKDVPAILLEVM